MKDIVFAWFCFLVSMDYSSFFVLTILEVYLIVCLELRFLILFLVLVSSTPSSEWMDDDMSMDDMTASSSSFSDEFV